MELFNGFERQVRDATGSLNQESNLNSNELVLYKPNTINGSSNQINNQFASQNSNSSSGSNSGDPKSLHNKFRKKSTFPFGKCKVCNDKATGVHYGISTCEGCKVNLKYLF